MLLKLLSRIKQHTAKTHSGNVCQDLKASCYPDIVSKLIIIRGLTKYLHPEGKGDESIFDINLNPTTTFKPSNDLGLSELCDRMGASVHHPHDDLFDVLCGYATYQNEELRACPYPPVYELDNYVRSLLDIEPSHVMDADRLGSIKCIHITLNNLFRLLVLELAVDYRDITVDVQRATPLELDWLMAGLEGEDRRFEFNTHGLPTVMCLRRNSHLGSLYTPITSWQTYMPSRSWSDGGYLFDKYDLEITRYDENSIDICPYGEDGDDVRPAIGSTRLIAGMRSILRTTHKEETITVPSLCAISRLGPEVWELFSSAPEK